MCLWCSALCSSISLSIYQGQKQTSGHDLLLNTVLRLSVVLLRQCAQAPELRAYLLPLVRFGDARMGDDFGCVNFAGGEVGHLVAFRKSSLEKGKHRKHALSSG